MIVWDLAEKEMDRCGGPWGASGTSKVRQLDSLIGFLTHVRELDSLMVRE